MKLFLIWPQKGDALGALIAMLTEAGHAISYFVGHTGAVAYAPKGAVFHDYTDAMNALPTKDVDANEFPPPDVEVLSKLYRVESLVLSMMDRLYPHYGVHERKRMYVSMVRYWLGVLQKHTPDLVIFPNLPHFAYDYVVYELAHLLGIRTIFFDDTRIPGRLLYTADFWGEGFNVLRRELLAADREKVAFSDLAEDVQKYALPRMKQGYDAAPPYILEQKKKYFAAQRLFSLGQLKRMFLHADFSFMRNIRTALSHNLKKEYERVARVPDVRQKFVYVPLQVQPERTTNPQGGVFADQILMLETLAAALPAGWRIYVKEHPIQWLHFGLSFSDARYLGYYETIARIKTVTVVPIDMSSYTLIAHGKAIAAVTGSAGFEAVLQLRPAILFGRVWFEDCPGILRADGPQSAREALQKVASGFTIHSDDVLRYLKCFERSTIHGCISKIAGKASGMTKEESMRNIARFLIDYIRHLEPISK